MTLQNRVDPWGVLHATPERGTMIGNRGGKFHLAGQTLGKRRWASTHWICCDLHYKNMKHEAMGQGYTSLFFLDEVTALSAGHRPCFFCRRKDAKAFLGDVRVGEFDTKLHAERLLPRIVGENIEGAMIEHMGKAYAVKNQNLLLWSFGGYTSAIPRAHVESAIVLTPPSIIAILKSGYKPRWHESAHQWD
jgi:hypothetical protein